MADLSLNEKKSVIETIELEDKFPKLNSKEDNVINRIKYVLAEAGSNTTVHAIPRILN